MHHFAVAQGMEALGGVVGHLGTELKKEMQGKESIAFSSSCVLPDDCDCWHSSVGSVLLNSAIWGSRHFKLDDLDLPVQL